MKKLLIIPLLFLLGCSPCNFVAKHQECFSPDSIIVNKETVKYEKQYITNDSIVFKAIPCDPIDSIIYKTRTVYKTNYTIKVDTIYQNKFISKINPLNEALKQERDILLQKAKTKNKILFILISIIIGLIVVYRFIK